MMLEHILVLSAYLFSIGIYGLITININFVTFFDIFYKRQLRDRKSTRINQSNLLNKQY
ncbi:hypothetical protein CDL12_05727 [Handroanthus impetiginosus]|uniref:Uncharacterized protein n=1 Tax=Handroanthus impetiginosus TaxID=429701 RepID=A0A2G9HW52_9LAMI|nr:hypothetical protein CDL12_05727 [Handroanthus impetiginosus]